MSEKIHQDASYFRSDRWLDYVRLQKERPEKFVQSDQLKICFDQNTILDFMNRTGRQIGVLYKSAYSMMVVDLVSDPSGNLFAYERLLPTAVQDAVVTVPTYEDRYVLLKQFRHSLRKDLVSFPRGFGENGLSALENAEKELNEEIGAFVTDAKIIGYVDPDSGLIGNRVAVVSCCVDNVRLMSDHEGIKELILLTKDELAENIRNGHISDGFTLAAFALLSSQK